MAAHVHTKQCGFDRNASHSAGHYVCACGFEDESAKRFEAPSFSPPAPHGPQGSWAVNDPRRAFVDGAKWWEWTKSEATMWQHDIGLAEKEAEARFAPTDEPALLSEITTNQRAACREDGSAGSSKPNGSQDSPAAAHPDLTLSAAQVERYRTELHKLFQHHVGVDALCNMALKTLAPVEAGAITRPELIDLLIQCELIDRDALDDADNWDNGVTSMNVHNFCGHVQRRLDMKQGRAPKPKLHGTTQGPKE